MEYRANYSSDGFHGHGTPRLMAVSYASALPFNQVSTGTSGGSRLTMMTKNYIWLVAGVALACFAPGVAAQGSSGTAFAVAPGLLVTNEHVVAGCRSIEIIAADGRRTGSVVDADAQIDLALLRVSGLKGATARLRKPRDVRLGESVMIFGFPLAGSLTSGGNFTSGLVSGLRGLRDAAGELQITAPVQRGNSGGPLLDASGLVVGVVQAKLDALRSAIATGDIPQNVNFAISLDVLADFLAKNNVAFRDGVLGSPLDTARVAELAQSFTHRVECRGRSQQAKAPPSTTRPQPAPPSSITQGQLPPCPGSFFGTWNSCIGEMRFIDGTTYVGEYKDGMRTGQGTYTLPNGTKYVGEFKDNVFNGQGTYTFPSGDNYVGEFKDGKYNGQGIFTWLNGQKHVGEFKDGDRHGQGTLYRADGTILQSGIWESDVVVRGR